MREQEDYRSAWEIIKRQKEGILEGDKGRYKNRYFPINCSVTGIYQHGWVFREELLQVISG